MANIGFKIAKAGTATSSSNIGDYIYWSKYPPLTLMDKVSSTINVSTANFLGTQSVNHGFDFTPLTLAVVNHTDNTDRYYVPAQQWTTSISCPLDDLSNSTDPRPNFSYTVGSTSVDIAFDVRCWSIVMGGGGPFAPSSSETFVVDLYYYMWEMGKSFSV